MKDAEHPITLPRALRFRVPPLLELLNVFSKLCRSGEVAMTCYSPPRSGKSTAMLFIYESMCESDKAVVFFADASRGPADSARLYRELASTAGRETPFKPESNAEAFIRRAQVEADARGTKRVWLLIDEAQRLTLEQLEELKLTIERLINRGLAPFVLLFAQPEILTKPARFEKVTSISIVDRFFVRMHRLRGLRLNEIEGALGFYDSTRWPAVTGSFYSQHYLPELWEAGWRMGTHAPHFRRAFEAICREFSRDPNDIPIKYLVFAASSLLLNHRVTTDAGADLERVVEKAVRDSGFTTALEVVGNAEKKMTNSPVPKRLRSEDA